jgi:hypothetical protein
MGAWVLGPLALVLFAMMPYFGLRSTGTFTMFSNLTTDGRQSNHYLLRNQPLKFAHYEDDVIQVVRADNRIYSMHRRDDWKYRWIPRVEFFRLVHEARRDRVERFGMRLLYRGNVYEVSDIREPPPRYRNPLRGR